MLPSKIIKTDVVNTAKRYIKSDSMNLLSLMTLSGAYTYLYRPNPNCFLKINFCNDILYYDFTGPDFIRNIIGTNSMLCPGSFRLEISDQSSARIFQKDMPINKGVFPEFIIDTDNINEITFTINGSGIVMPWVNEAADISNINMGVTITIDEYAKNIYEFTGSENL